LCASLLPFLCISCAFHVHSCAFHVHSCAFMCISCEFMCIQNFHPSEFCKPYKVST
jgi:hypothetical protein